MTEQIDDKIHRIVSDKVEENRKEFDRKLDQVKEISVENSRTLASQDKVLGKIETKIDSIYGNGSGRKGILDDIKDEQKNVRDTLALETKKLAEALDVETKKQANFRHEIRDVLDTMQLQKRLEQDKIAEEEKKRESSYKHTKDKLLLVKWLVGGIAFISWELFKTYVLRKL